MAIPAWCHDTTALDLLRLARSHPTDLLHRQNLATWLIDNGRRISDPDSLDLGEALRASFQTGELVLLPPETAQRLHPLVGALHGWLYGVQDNSDAVARLWLLPPHSLELAPNVWLEMLPVSAGTFLMGTPDTEAERDDDEILHEVTLTQPFLVGKYPVTQEQWQSVMGRNPSYFQGGNLPVEMVSWNDAHEFFQKVREKTGQAVCLPTEAQWEYTCRAGTSTPFHFGSVLNGTQANCVVVNHTATTETGPDLQKTSQVGSYAANAWGLHDMHGNVWEWCQDWYGEYSKEPVKDPQGVINGQYRVLRGGSWLYNAWGCRSGLRIRVPSGYQGSRCGIRLILPL